MRAALGSARGAPGRSQRRPALGGLLYLLSPSIKVSTGIAARVMSLMLPREANSADTRAIVSLSGASTMFTKS